MPPDLSKDYLKQLAEDIRYLKNGQEQLIVKIGRIEERLESTSVRFIENKNEIGDIEKRLRKVETRLAIVYAVAALLGTAGGGLINFILFFMIRR